MKQKRTNKIVLLLQDEKNIVKAYIDSDMLKSGQTIELAPSL